MREQRFYRFITIAWLGFCLVSCASRAETESAPKPIDAAAIGDTLARAETLFREREDMAKLREAVKLVGALRNPDARNFEVEWKFSKYSFFLGKYSDNEKESEKSLEDGLQAGRIASRIEPNKPDGYFWYGANLGEQARKSPVTVGVKAVDDIQEAMNKVIELAPDYQGASAYDALAQIELSTAGLMGGKPEKAVEYLEKALQLNSENTYLHLHLAEALIAAGKKPEAKKRLEALLKMKPHPDYLPEYNETTEKAKKLLETKF